MHTGTIRVIILLLAVILTGCGKGDRHHDDGGTPVEMRYAKLLTVRDNGEYVTVQVTDPWDSTRVLHRYVLVSRDKELPGNLPEGDVVRVPLKNAVVYTSVHCGLISELGSYASIRGVCDLQYINMSQLHKDVEKGRIRDLGESMTPNIEGIMEMQPDAILLSPFENNGGYGKVGKMGIPLIECADYMENTPLGRAEWVRFYGLLFGRQREADSLFASVEKRYNELKAESRRMMKARGKKPTVVTEMKIGSTWYVAGGESTVGILIRDAGGDYIFKDVKEKGALPYNPEAVYEQAKDADVWLIKYNQATDMTLDDLKSLWAVNARMRAFTTGGTYGCNLSRTQFYEETPFHPDVLLSEYVNILNGAVGVLKYYKKL